MFVPSEDDPGPMVALESQGAERWQDRVWDALQTGLTVWGAYVLFLQLVRRRRR